MAESIIDLILILEMLLVQKLDNLLLKDY
jgi:hypothetical protein